MSRNITALVLVLAAALAGPTISAQPVVPGDGYASAGELVTIFRVGSDAGQLRLRLDLPPAKYAAAQAVSEKFRATLREGARDGAEPARRKELAAAANHEIDELFSEPERDRVRRIQWQEMGAAALLDADLAGKIGLTPGQLERLREINGLAEAEYRRKLAQLPRATADAVAQLARESETAKRSRMLALLDAGQRARREELLGKP